MSAEAGHARAARDHVVGTYRYFAEATRRVDDELGQRDAAQPALQLAP